MIPKGLRRLPRLNTMGIVIIRDKKGTKTINEAEKGDTSRHLRNTNL